MHREIVLVALTALALLAIYLWASRYWIELMDEGYFLSLAERVHRGQLPYRDFDTYYTPGIFYLDATLFRLFGVSVIPIRVLMASVRVACAVLLYGLTRRVAPWPFAILPFLVLAGVDAIPVSPEPHPAWLALVGSLLCLEALARHQRSGRLFWLGLAGAAAGLAFLFKQNVGAFVLLTVLGYVVLRPRGVGSLVRRARLLFVLGLGLSVTVFLRPALNVLVAAAIWLPTLAALALLVRESRRDVRLGNGSAGVRGVLAEATLAGLAFLGVTVLWLIPLMVALEPARTPFGLFLGSVNQGALIWRLEPPPPLAPEVALLALLAPLGTALLFRQSSVGQAWRLGGGLALGSLLILWMPILAEAREPATKDPGLYPLVDFLGGSLGTLYPYLPGLCAWAGVLGLLLRGPTDSAEPAPWYLLGGVLVALAMYPRMDTPHAMFAGPLLFVVGAWALSRAHRRLARSVGIVGQAAVFVALLVIPLTSITADAYWRYVAIVHPDPDMPEASYYVPLGLERAPVLVPKRIAENVRGVVEFVRDGTPPGQPLFVYPASPMFNFLADRPNPTRFDHYLPGALTPADMAQVVADLEAARPRYVIWDQSGVDTWQTDPANRPLTDYLERCYTTKASFTPYLVLERQPC